MRRLASNLEQRQWQPLIAALCAVAVSLVALLCSSALQPAVQAEESLLAKGGFAGSAACQQCHPAIHASHGGTSMRAALLPPQAARALASKVPVEGAVGPARYSLRMENGQFVYRTEFQGRVLQAPVRWVFGLGAAGQTYVLEHEGQLLESRVSYYDAIAGLDLTIGAANKQPETLEEAAGRRMEEADVRECFGCHALGVPERGEPTLAGIEPGVGCENCHGPAAAHVAARRAGNLQEAKMPSLKQQEAEESSQLCGKCHRTWEDVVSMGIRGVNNVRFQPYRLTLSRCFDSSDTRISCVACHNPHENVSRVAASYDQRCLACHQPNNAAPDAAVCKAGQRSACSTCHMPKRDLPGAHRGFTDHYIRVHREGEAYPDL